ncbi:hypothetical protein Rleg9DRAFT_1737 [Rhizobium leguminosarum bv. trifolii WSM597]|uniref:Uncharacterized protein n=1 Tax=Rhizobium leguminosarum bv. trifolii WSM597 TaxID=754764 RepID=I9N899_RHILT|nr:hypothetical protein [Rhizobium leguminosarum]EJB02922.1 hypothetical protein Rleg9DRAFT_1737 [Rhizobium leguminosarum bv. trifolii WSM597]
MDKNRASGECKFGLPIFAEPGLSRILIEHGDGRWSICLVRPAVTQQFPNRPVEADCTFTMDSVIETACKAFSSDPSIKDDRESGRKLAAAVIMFSMALGILDEREVKA